MSIILDQSAVADILPQAYPFIMVDQVIEYEKGESLTAVKNITGNEWVFEGESCKNGVFPETLLIEAAAQTVILYSRLSSESPPPDDALFLMGQSKAEFLKPVFVGDQILLKTGNSKLMKESGFVEVELIVDSQKVAEMTIYYSVKRNEK